MNFYLECSKEVRFSDRKDKIYLSMKDELCTVEQEDLRDDLDFDTI